MTKKTAPDPRGGFLFGESAGSTQHSRQEARCFLDADYVLAQSSLSIERESMSIQAYFEAASEAFNNRPYPNNLNHLLLKCGTDVLVGARKQLDQRVFNDIARQCEALWTKVTVVSSGAVKAGEESIHGDLPSGWGALRDKEYAAIGARHLLQKWGDAFALYQHEIAQIWVTPVNLNDDDERDRIKTAIRNCHRHGAVPIVNENDVVSESSSGMDNDFLAASIAELTWPRPDAVLFLTGVGGVYDEDPAENSHACRYNEMDVDAACALASAASTLFPIRKRGMGQKLLQAVRCVEMGMRVGIAGPENDNILRFAAGESVGTIIRS